MVSTVLWRLIPEGWVEGVRAFKREKERDEMRKENRIEEDRMDSREI